MATPEGGGEHPSPPGLTYNSGEPASAETLTEINTLIESCGIPNSKANEMLIKYEGQEDVLLTNLRNLSMMSATAGPSLLTNNNSSVSGTAPQQEEEGVPVIDSNSGPPSQGVFNHLGVMELERRSFNESDTTPPNGTHTIDDEENSDDDEDIEQDFSNAQQDRSSLYPSSSYDGVSGDFQHKPSFDHKGKFIDYHQNKGDGTALAAISDLENNTNNNNLHTSNGMSYDTPTRAPKGNKKYYYGGGIIVLLTVLIVMIVFLVAPSGDNQLNTNPTPSPFALSPTSKFANMGVDAPSPDSSDAVPKAPSPSGYTPDELNELSNYGWKYVQDVKIGWISWPQEYDTDTFLYYNKDDGVNDLISCAKKCKGEDAPTGAWSIKYQACWCNFVSTSSLCKEPCVEEEYVDFSTVPFTEYDYCEKSVCDKDWHHSQEYCDNEIMFNKDTCDFTIGLLDGLSSDDADAIVQGPADGTHDADGTVKDLSSYGYPYAQDTNVGWISWPPHYDESSFETFKSSDGVDSIESCAAKCQELNAPTGAWSVKYAACWCNFVKVSTLCKEPCIEEDYIDFSSVPFTNFDYCDKSVCDKDWYHSEWYCDVDVEFDVDVCDTKIAALGIQANDKHPVIDAKAGKTEPNDDYVDDDDDDDDDYDDDDDISSQMEVDFDAISKSGFPYSQTVFSGWVSWPKEEDDDTFESFDSDDGVDSAESCAAKCNDEGAPTGAWSDTYEACWCNFLPTDKLCKEPCVKETYVEFSTVSFDKFDYCEESVCSKDWHHSQAYCDDTIKFDQGACDVTIAALSAAALEPEDDGKHGDDGGASDTDVDLSTYGYPHIQDVSDGWMSWPQDYNDDNFKTYDEDDGVTSVETCAEKCSADGAPTGAWSVNYEACWCNFVDIPKICKEPCVEEEYVEFSTVSFSHFHYCDESVCAKDWHHSQEYCDDTIKFDSDVCAKKIEDLATGTDLNLQTQTDLSNYGYPHIQDVESGWLSWPKTTDDDNFKTFTADDGVTSVAECASKCNNLDAPTGAWSVEYEACWCNFVDTSKLCKEPCVEEEYIEFSRVSFMHFDYCDESVCDKDWHHSQEYCDDTIKFDTDVCQQSIDALTSPPSDDVAPYPYIQDVKVGWMSWPKDTNDDNFQTFNSDDGVDSAETCAAKCNSLDAPAGAWSVKYQACWCNFVDSSKVCREPCVEEEYVEFSNVSFEHFGYCEESICAKDWHHSQSYCDDTIKFDEDVCQLSIDALLAPPAAKVDPYPYIQDVNVGWISWPQITSDDNFKTFTADDDGVTSADECAIKCDELDAPTGGWSDTYQACWCNFVDASQVCKEPCVEEEYIEFSKVSFEHFDYCTESVCDKDWHHSQEYCDDTVKFDADVCQKSIDALTGSGPVDLSTLGYEYIQDVTVGWMSWPKNESSDTFKSFDDEDGVTSVAECAAKCKEINAPTGAWSVVYEACWCNLVDSSNLCKEPCVEEEYVEFSTVSFDSIGYCSESVCAKDWHHSQEYCDDDVSFDSDVCDVTIAALVPSSEAPAPEVPVPSPPETPSSPTTDVDVQPSASVSDISNPEFDDLDLTQYGFRFILNSKTGWLSWPQSYDTTSLSWFDEDDGVTSVEECAAKCSDLESHAGAWSIRLEACWCNKEEPKMLCKEPCVEEEYVDFSTVPFTDFLYCEESVCNHDWYHSDEYCDVDVQFDETACDATIETLMASTTTSTVAAPVVPLDEQVYLKPTAVATTKQLMPDSNTGGQVHLSVEGDGARYSFVRFDIPEFAQDEKVIDATLSLYLTSHHKEGDPDDVYEVKVEALPQAGPWAEGTVSFNAQLADEGSILIDTFEAKKLPNIDDRKKLYEVDILSAIQSDTREMTFKLSMDSPGRIDFAGKTWSQGDSMPTVMLTVEKSTADA